MKEALPVTHDSGLQLANACSNVAALITATHLHSNSEGWQEKTFDGNDGSTESRWSRLDQAMEHLYRQWQKLQIEETNGELPW